jgi:hypothetical protein
MATEKQMSVDEARKLFDETLAKYESRLFDGDWKSSHTHEITPEQLTNVLTLFEHTFTRQVVFHSKGASNNSVVDNLLQLMSTVIIILGYINDRVSKSGPTLANIIRRPALQLAQALKVALDLPSKAAIIVEQPELADLDLNQCAGLVWRLCDKIKKLPEDDISAIVQKILEVLVLIKDAKDELEDAFKDEELTEEDEEFEVQKQALLIKPQMSKLLSAAQATVKQLYGYLIVQKQAKASVDVEWMETVLVQSDQISQRIDEMVSSLYEICDDRSAVFTAVDELRRSI